jgi:hypothetical protein
MAPLGGIRRRPFPDLRGGDGVLMAITEFFGEEEALREATLYLISTVTTTPNPQR